MNTYSASLLFMNCQTHCFSLAIHLIINMFSKGHVWRCKTPSITTQKTVNYNAKHGLLQHTQRQYGTQAAVLRHSARHSTHDITTRNVMHKSTKSMAFRLKTRPEQSRNRLFSNKNQKNIYKILQKRKNAVSLHSLTTSKGS